MAKKLPLTLLQKLQKIKQAGISESPTINRYPNSMDELSSLDERIKKVLGLIDTKDKNAGNMLFFVMYDIESNKVRNQISKYLISKGCIRVQRSIFLAQLETSAYETIKNDLVEVQAMYENNDSILVVPISTDYLDAMKVIGQSINVDLITHRKNVIFF